MSRTTDNRLTENLMGICLTYYVHASHWFLMNKAVFSVYKPVGYTRKAFTNFRSSFYPCSLLPLMASNSCQYLFSVSGKSEDWKNMFNDCQRSDFDAVFEVQMQNSHLKLMWTCTDIEMTATCPVLKDCLHAG